MSILIITKIISSFSIDPILLSLEHNLPCKNSTRARPEVLTPLPSEGREVESGKSILLCVCGGGKGKTGRGTHGDK